MQNSDLSNNWNQTINVIEVTSPDLSGNWVENAATITESGLLVMLGTTNGVHGAVNLRINSQTIYMYQSPSGVSYAFPYRVRQGDSILVSVANEATARVVLLVP